MTLPAAPRPSQPRAGQIPALEGIRGVAVSLVFLSHGGLGHLIPGGFGVTIFFVLSGYLITTLMRQEVAERGSIDFRAFYLRRFLRLTPPLFIVLLLAWLLAVTDLLPGGYTVGGLLSVLLYFANYFVILNDFHGVPAGMGVAWSLAVEEHYYLLYPPVALWLLTRASSRQSLALLTSACAVILGWRYWLVHAGASPEYLEMATDARLDAILFGCILALFRNPWLDPVARARPVRDTLVAMACLGVLAGSFLYREPTFRVTLRYTLQGLALLPLFHMAVTYHRTWPFRVLSWRPLTFLGSISYTIYLVHHVVMNLLLERFPQLSATALLLTAAPISIAIAVPMRRWIEEPCARLRRRLHRPAGAAARGIRAPTA